MLKKSLSFKLNTIQEDGFFSGYGSNFGNVDSYGDIVVKGAFTDTIADWKSRGKMPPVLWNHKYTEPIGVYSKIEEDETGLYVEGRLLINDVVKAKEAHALMLAGAIDGLSIGYDTLDFVCEGDVTKLLKLKLYEISVVTFPANEESRIELVKSMLGRGELPTLPEFEKFLREAGFSKTQATAIAGHGLRKLRSESDDENANAKYIQEAIKILKGNK